MTHNRYATGGIRAGLRGSSFILLLIAAALFATSCQSRHREALYKGPQPQAAPHKVAGAALLESPVSYVRYDLNFHVNADGSYVETRTVAAKILTPQAVSKAKHAFVYDDRFGTAKVFYAYTLKRNDGGRVYAYISNGKSKALPLFSHIRIITMKFPDLAVGDTIVTKYRITQAKPTLPGNFSLLASFSKFVGWEHARITMSAPESLRMKIEARGVEGGEITSKDGRKRWVWTYQNLHPAPPELESVSSLDYGPMIAASTFKDYGAVAAAYAVRAKAKTLSDAHIRELADRITRDAHTERAQAAALYYWVSQNIRNAGNYGVVTLAVPHQASAILKNRMGNSEDHSTLLRAMLAAKGIRSTDVLIRSGILFNATFTLPTVPTTRIFNRVITYIPSLNLYADSTSRFTPFGKLPLTDADKPVIYTTGYDGIRHTPPTSWRDNGTVTRTVLTINPDGSASGETRFTMQGFFASVVRALMSSLWPNREQEATLGGLVENGYTRTAALNPGDPSKPTDVYRYSESYDVTNALNPSGPGAFTIRGAGNFSAKMLSANAKAPKQTVNYACMGFYMEQFCTIHMPRNVKILGVPSDVHLRGSSSRPHGWHATYTATYKREGNTVTVERILDDRVPGNVCTPKDAATFKPFTMRVIKDLHSQILYK